MKKETTDYSEQAEKEVAKKLVDLGTIGIGACTGMTKDIVMETAVPIAEYTDRLMQKVLATVTK